MSWFRSTTRCTCCTHRARRADRRQSCTVTAGSSANMPRPSRFITTSGQGDRFFWFSTTGWMMWNYLVSGLLTGASIVLFDGDPAFPDLLALWRLAAETGITVLGLSAPYLDACRRAELEPGASIDLRRVRAIGSTGAPLSAAAATWAAHATGSRCADQLHQRRDRCLHGLRRIQPGTSGEGRRDVLSNAGRQGGGVGCRPQASSRSPRRTRDHRTDAIDAGGVVGRHRWQPLGCDLLRSESGGLDARRLDHHPCRRFLRDHRAKRRHPEPGRSKARLSGNLRRARGRPRGRRQPRHPSRGEETSSSSSSCSAETVN